jgi:hypothetical protein
MHTISSYTEIKREVAVYLKELALIEGPVHADHGTPCCVSDIMENDVVDCAVVDYFQCAAILEGVINRGL